MVSIIALGCVGASTGGAGARPTRADASPLPDGPRPPAKGLDMPALDVEWRLPELRAGDLASVLARPPAAAAENSRAVARGRIAAEGIDPAVVSRALGPRLEGWRVEVGEGPPGLAFSKGWPVASLDERGGLQVLDPSAELDEEWLADARAAGERRAWLVAPLRIEESAWRVQPANRSGSCDPLFARFGEAQEAALVRLESHLDHLDRVLAVRYADALADEPQADPQRVEGLELAAGMPAGCASVRDRLVEEFRLCAEGEDACVSRPRVLLSGGVEVGAPARFIGTPECIDAASTELERRLGTAQRSAALQLRSDTRQGVVSGSWVELAARAAALSQIYDALDDACGLRRRRIDPEAFESLTARIAGLPSLFRRAPAELGAAGRWVERRGRIHLPGVGEMERLVRFDAAPATPAASLEREAATLFDAAMGTVRCAAGLEELPYVVVTVDVDAGRVDGVALAYSETLTCDTLPAG